MRLFARKGFFETSFQDVADKLNCPQSTVMNHFPNRKALFLSVRNFVVEKNKVRVDQLIRKNCSAWEKLIDYALLNIENYLENRDSGKIILLFYYYASQDKQFYKIHKQAEANGIERICNLLGAAQREGAINEDINLSLSAEAVQHYLRGLVLREFMLDNKKWLEKDARATIDRRLRALVKNESQK